MSEATLIYGARQLITMHGPPGPRRRAEMAEPRIIEDGAVLIRDGKIAEVGPARRFIRLAAARGAEEIDAYGKVVMPGFVDCSVSLLCGPAWHGGSGAALPVRTWSPQRMEIEAKRRLRWFARSGTTTIGAGCGHGRDEATELKALRVLKSLDERMIGIEPMLQVLERAPEFDNDEAYAEWLRARLIPEVRRRRLAKAIECTPWPGVEAAAEEAGMKARVRSEGWIHAGPVTIVLPAAAGVPEDGGPLAVSTGFDAAASPFNTMAAALWLARTRFGLSAEEVITAATINAAWALGVERRTGSLEPGKDADILMLQTGDYRDLSWYLGASPVAMVFAKGVEIFPRLETL